MIHSPDSDRRHNMGSPVSKSLGKSHTTDRYVC